MDRVLEHLGTLQQGLVNGAEYMFASMEWAAILAENNNDGIRATSAWSRLGEVLFVTAGSEGSVSEVGPVETAPGAPALASAGFSLPAARPVWFEAASMLAAA